MSVVKPLNASFKVGDSVNYKRFKKAKVIQDFGGANVIIKTDLANLIIADRSLVSLAIESV